MDSPTATISASAAARRLGRAKKTVCRACARHGIGRRAWPGPSAPILLSEEDVARLAEVIQDGPGNPEWRKSKA